MRLPNGRLRLEAISRGGALQAFEEYKAGRITELPLRQRLGFETCYELDVFLRTHEVWLPYTPEDRERERAALRRDSRSKCGYSSRMRRRSTI